eukprot:TRINITY_DN79822_c0_g1_i1.p1 TRINITY_DN79822_c0_g1~~TRINITY_DN79822_c0_g1_i1.p1  ORF type:complete len:538 (-),score=97.19 TRINITY_DN79822_c0_g1_i1:73-1686(-)
MLRRLVGQTGWGANNSADNVAIEALVNSHRQLLLDGGRADVRSEAGYSACAMFLSSLETVARTIGVEAAKRDYRKVFSANYQALFPDDARHYRVDVLEASADQHSAIWVNGDKFELSAEAICQAEALQSSWSQLCSMLAACAGVAGKQPPRQELTTVLTALDAAWAGFEHKYIAELIGIEEQARKLIVQAVQAEMKLGSLDEIPNTDESEYRQAQATLVHCIAHLNSVANFQRKGRDDLGPDILYSALAALEKSNLTSKQVVAAAEGNGMAAAAVSAAEARNPGINLAIDVVASYEAMRRYLKEVSRCLERVDPHLCNNVGLVARLVDWEESWEIGARYVREEALLHSINDLVTECRAAGRLEPAFTNMCADFDVELFLVLPRIVLLACLSQPSAPRNDLLRSLLPHRFPEPASPCSLNSNSDAEMAKLVDGFTEVLSSLSAHSGSTTGRAWAHLLRRAVAGTSEAVEDGYAGLQISLNSAVPGQVEALMRDVEKCSLELQRHCAEDWNQCSAVLVQCIQGGSQKSASLTPGGKFQV